MSTYRHNIFFQRALEARVTNDERRVPCSVGAELHSKGTWSPEDYSDRRCFLHMPDDDMPEIDIHNA